MARQISIQIGGDIADETAAALGCRVVREHGVWLTVDYVDQSQLAGLLLQFGDLHITFETVMIRSEPEDTDSN